jgi:hypothetical protein
VNCRRIVVEQGGHRYRLVALEASSAKFGPCEVCGEHVSDVHRQAEEYAVGDTWRDGRDLFGHLECLEASRVDARVVSLLVRAGRVALERRRAA